MSDESRGSALKWLVGVAIGLAAAGGGVAAWYNLIHPTKPSASPTEPSARNCEIAGNVYNEKGYAPIADVHVEYDAGQGSFTHAATTRPDGSFKFSCSTISKTKFPLKLRLSRNDWPKPAPVAESVSENDDSVVLYVDATTSTPVVFLRRISPEALKALQSPSPSPSINPRTRALSTRPETNR